MAVEIPSDADGREALREWEAGWRERLESNAKVGVQEGKESDSCRVVSRNRALGNLYATNNNVGFESIFSQSLCHICTYRANDFHSLRPQGMWRGSLISFSEKPSQVY